METMNSEMRYDKPGIADHRIFLWLKQHTRKLLRKSYLQGEILEKIVKKAIKDENLLGILLFGSVVANTHTWKSDIDLIFIYNDHKPTSGLIKYFISGIGIDSFYATLENLIENQKTVPYLLQMFSEANILFDRHNTVTPIIDEIKQYFAKNLDIQKEWIRIKQSHQVEKRGSKCGQVTIIDRWNELEDKYSGGLRKRTFFNVG
jgi:predicted nucleotidyltransferase